MADVGGFCQAVGIASQMKLLQFELNMNLPFSVELVEKVYGRGKGKNQIFPRTLLPFIAIKKIVLCILLST